MAKTLAKVLCSCKGQSAEFQDRTYGKDVRIANFVTKSEKSGLTKVDVRCTCCGKLHSIEKSKLQ